jgi:hypothetical protein
LGPLKERRGLLKSLRKDDSAGYATIHSVGLQMLRYGVDLAGVEDLAK